MIESQTVYGILIGLTIFSVIMFAFIGWEIWNDE